MCCCANLCIMITYSSILSQKSFKYRYIHLRRCTWSLFLFCHCHYHLSQERDGITIYSMPRVIFRTCPEWWMILGLFGLCIQYTMDCDEIMHTAWCCLGEVPYCFSRSSVKFQGHTALKIVEFDPNWAFPDCNSSLNSPMGSKWCTKLEVAWKRCPIVFEGHR